MAIVIHDNSPTGKFTRYLVSGRTDVYVVGVDKMIGMVVAEFTDAISVITRDGNTELVDVQEDGDSDGQAWVITLEDGRVVETLHYAAADGWTHDHHEVFVDGFDDLAHENDRLD